MLGVSMKYVRRVKPGSERESIFDIYIKKNTNTWGGDKTLRVWTKAEYMNRFILYN